jgi:hypothetical protein
MCRQAWTPRPPHPTSATTGSSPLPFDACAASCALTSRTNHSGSAAIAATPPATPAAVRKTSRRLGPWLGRVLWFMLRSILLASRLVA